VNESSDYVGRWTTSNVEFDSWKQHWLLFLLLHSTYFIIQLICSELQNGRPVKMTTLLHVVPKLLLAVTSW